MLVRCREPAFYGGNQGGTADMIRPSLFGGRFFVNVYIYMCNENVL